jgi:hypothetical protein
MFIQGILNEGDRDDLVIGVPTRYGGRLGALAAIRSNWLLTTVSILTSIKDIIVSREKRNSMNANDILEERIQQNRIARMKNIFTEPE